jgi:hypothetical protein
MKSIKWSKLSDWGSWPMFNLEKRKSLQEWITQQDIESLDYQPQPPTRHLNLPVCYNLVIVHRRPGGRLDRHLLSMEYSTPLRPQKGAIFPDLPFLLLYPVGALHKPSVIIPEYRSMFALRTWTRSIECDYNLEWYKYDYNFITWNHCRYSVHTYPYITDVLEDYLDPMARKGDMITHYGLKIRQIPGITPLAEIYVQRSNKFSSDIWKLVLMFLKNPGERPGPIRF